ncbi:MAG: FKBP-type peptidyl-prolyl cis-trans isomerase [Verrucomicrobiaceae bacterium]|nr:FKBP-type peptidyl-prolyl cis-trans isomerase [Verrucomicrobiaceae bacterium]
MKPLQLAISSALLALTACQSPARKTEEPATAPAPTKKADSSGVVTTASGLRYKVLASGPAGGRSPTRADTVMVHYRGTLVDGSVFDSSYDRGEPTTFGVAQVIPGWTEALQLMKPGDKWLLHIPSNLAYGAQGAGAKIPPFADLTFQVELLQIMGRL